MRGIALVMKLHNGECRFDNILSELHYLFIFLLGFVFGVFLCFCLQAASLKNSANKLPH